MDLDKLLDRKINDLNNKINNKINNLVGSYSPVDKTPFNGKVRIDENDDGLYAIKRINGTLVSDYYDEIEYYTDSLAKVYSDGKEAYALMDAQGNLVSDWYADIEEVKDGYALVSNDDDQYALINRQGNRVSDWSDDYDAVDSWRHTDELKAELAAEMQAPQVEEPEPTHAPEPQAAAPEPQAAAPQPKSQVGAAFVAPFVAAQAARPARQTTQPKTNKNGMFNDHIETLINAALADGVLTEKEKQVLFKRAQAEGVDLDEFEMLLDARLVELQKAEKAKNEKENPEKAAPKSNKFGDVRKCPNCGAVIGSFQMACPECGFEFTNVGVNKYVEKLAKGLEELAQMPESNAPKTVFSEMMGWGAREQMMHAQQLPYNEARFIRNYPLPMSKEDCIEALNFILPKITIAGSTPATRAWYDKYIAIIQKLEIEAVTNKKLENVVAAYKQKAQLSGGAKFMMWYKSLSQIAKIFFWYAMFFVVVGLIAAIAVAFS